MAEPNPYLLYLAHQAFLGYSGDLAAGIDHPTGTGLLSTPGPDEMSAVLSTARAAKVPALFEHFGIDALAPNPWERLAICLAAAHVPGFNWSGRDLTLLHGSADYMPLLKAAFTPEPDWIAALFRPRHKLGRRPKFRPSNGLLGNSGTSEPRRPAHRPAVYSQIKKRRLVERFDTLLAKAKRTNSKLTHAAFAENEFGDEGKNVLALYYRFKREVGNFKKS